MWNRNWLWPLCVKIKIALCNWLWRPRYFEEGPQKAIISTRGRSAAAFIAAAAAFSLVACAQSTAIGLRSWRKYYVEAIYTALLSPQRPPRLLASTIEAVSWASKSRYKYTPASSPRVIAATARLLVSGTVSYLFFCTFVEGKLNKAFLHFWPHFCHTWLFFKVAAMKKTMLNLP